MFAFNLLYKVMLVSGMQAPAVSFALWSTGAAEHSAIVNPTIAMHRSTKVCRYRKD